MAITEHLYAQDFDRDSNSVEVLVGPPPQKLGNDVNPHASRLRLLHRRGEQLTVSRSLRLRLIAGGAIWILAALVVAGVAIAYFFAASVEQRVRSDLESTLDRLSAVIDPAAPLSNLDHPLQDPRYDTPFGGLYCR